MPAEKTTSPADFTFSLPSGAKIALSVPTKLTPHERQLVLDWLALVGRTVRESATDTTLDAKAANA